MNLFISILEQSFIMMPLIMGIYISYSILKITDISVEGAFVLGAAISAKLIADYSADPGLAVLAAMCGGVAVGIILAKIQKEDKIDPLIAGIIMVFMLYSINLQVMGKPNINLYGKPLLPDRFNNQLFFYILITACTALPIFGMFYTRIGLLLRAFGENKDVFYKIKLNPENYRMLGLIISNSLAAMCGALTCPSYTYADVNMGFGLAITGISAVIAGTHVVRYFSSGVEKFSPFREFLSCLTGTLMYFLAVNLLLKYGVAPSNLKFALGVVLILFLKFSAKGKLC